MCQKLLTTFVVWSSLVRTQMTPGNVGMASARNGAAGSLTRSIPSSLPDVPNHEDDIVAGILVLLLSHEGVHCHLVAVSYLVYGGFLHLHQRGSCDSRVFSRTYQSLARVSGKDGRVFLEFRSMSPKILLMFYRGPSDGAPRVTTRVLLQCC